MLLPSQVASGSHTELLARLSSADAPLVAIIAPPGYGKHELAAAYAQRCGVRIALSAAHAGSLEEIWASGAGRGTSVLIDQTDGVPDDELRRLLLALLASRPPHGRIVLCLSREPSFAFVELLEPHLCVILRERDLQTSLAQLRAKVPPERYVDDMTLYRIHEFSGGWPIVAEYLLGAALHGNANDLTHIDERSWPDLFDWAELTVLSPLDESTREALLAATVRMEAVPTDFPGTGRANAAMRLVREYQLADVGIMGELRVAPFIRLYLHLRARRELIETAYRILAADGGRDPVRAARALINVGELRRAETVMYGLDDRTCLSVGDYPYPGMLLETLSPIKPPYQLYPRVWAALFASRGFTEDVLSLAHEGAYVCARSALEPEMLRWLRFMTAMAFTRARELNVALLFVDELSEASDDEPSAALVDAACCIIDAVNGSYARAIARWHASGSELLATPSMYALVLRSVVRVTFVSGLLARAKELNRLMSSLTRVGSSPFVYASSIVEGAILAWLEGNEVEFERLREELSRSLVRYEAPKLWNIHAAMHGLALSGGMPVGDPYLDTIAAIMLACTPRADAGTYAAAAVQASDLSRNAWLRCTARVVAAARNPQQRSALLAEARALEASIEAPGLSESIEAVAAGGPPAGSLRALLEHIERPVPCNDAEHARGTFIDVAAGRVLSDGRPLKISDGVMQLLVCLAVNGGSAKRERLIDLIWPELDAIAATAALKMCVHRARAQLGDPSAVLVSRGTYALGRGVQSNYRRFLEFAPRTLSLPLPDGVRTEMEHLVRHFLEAGDGSWATWSWFAPYARALSDAAQSIGDYVVRDFLLRGELESALHLARMMSAARPLDERPRHLLIQAYLALRQPGEARREYREFQCLVREELGAEPSAELTALLNAG